MLETFALLLEKAQLKLVLIKNQKYLSPEDQYTSTGKGGLGEGNPQLIMLPYKHIHYHTNAARSRNILTPKRCHSR